MKTLDDFMLELRRDVDSFEKDWRANHKKKPKEYPLSFEAENTGMWWEQFMAHLSMNGRWE